MAWTYLVIRFIVICFTLVAAKQARTVTSAAGAERWAFAVVAVYGSSITTMIFLADGASSVYFSGLNLVCLASICSMPFRKKFVAYVLGVIYAPYVGISIIDCWHHPSKINAFLLNLAFISSMAIMSVFFSRFRAYLKKSEYEHRVNLAIEVKNRAKIIAEKTRETVHLRELSRQFSPQVVQAIVENRISLADGLTLAPICVIFVDAVGSTDRIVKIDRDDFSVVISKFVEDSMRILIHHDLTIDKFLGDGILAFAGAPLPIPNYVDRVLAAAVDIVNKVENDQEFYQRHWGTSFCVRVGIASGLANVGFYGDRGILRCYTAIGEAINLAARLCAEAAPGQILVAEAVVKASSLYTVSFERVNPPLKLKGFEGMNVTAHTLETTPRVDEASAKSMTMKDSA